MILTKVNFETKMQVPSYLYIKGYLKQNITTFIIKVTIFIFKTQNGTWIKVSHYLNLHLGEG